MPTPNASAPRRWHGEARGEAGAVVKPQANDSATNDNGSTFYDIATVAGAALDSVNSVLRRWLPNGKRNGHEYAARNPTRNDNSPGSFSINANNGKWSDFATGDAGGDLVSLVAYLEGCTQGEAANSLGQFLGLPGEAAAGPRTKAKATANDAGELVSPVPADAPPPPTAHYKHGRPSASWTYTDANGRTLSHVHRFDHADGSKDVLPLTLWRKDGALRWQWKGYPTPRPLYGLDRLAARPDAPVLIVEGEKAADAAALLLSGFVAITSPGGCKGAKHADWLPLAGRSCTIWPDADEPGAAYADDAERLALEAGAAAVSRVDLAALEALRGAPLPKGWDAADALAEGLGIAELPILLDAEDAPGASLAEVFAAARAAKSARPMIDIRTGDLPTTIDGCERALIQAGAPIYARGEMLARAVPAPLEPGNVKRAAGALILTAVTIAALQDDLERIADFQRWINGPNGPDPKPADAPAKACRALLDRVGRWRFPQLRGIALAPFIRTDGSVACTPGYDRESGLLLAIPSDWPAPPINPTRADALAALARLRHLIRTFAFVTPEDESVAIAAMLSPFVRPAIEAAPMFGYSAPVRGSGKSMLADLVAILATGRPATAMTWGPDADENAKALASALLAGDAVVMLDNVETPLRGELLCSALTQSSLRLRPLGRSELVTIPCVATLLATGNALTPAGDMTRRALVAELDPQCERPELREFTNDPKTDALAERAELVNACLTIITAGMGADYRRPPPLGSYSQWSRLVRDPLIWLGMPDPITVMERTFDQDPEREAAIGILAAWRDVYGDSAATAAEASKAAAAHSMLADALGALATRVGSVSTKALGQWLRRHEGRVLGGLKVQKFGGTTKHGIHWRVVEHGVSGVNGVSLPASRTEGGSHSQERKTDRPNETPETPLTPPTNDTDDWGDFP